MPSTDFTVTGLVNSDAVTGVTLTSAGAAATADIAGSPYTITVNGATGTGLGNYNIIYTPALMTVTPIDLTIAAVNVSKVYGTTYTFDETVPSTDFTVTGLVNSDAVTGVTLTSAGAAATADIAGSPYTITVNGATGTGLGNYNIIYTPALMTVTPIDLTIAAVNVSKVYGTTYTFDETVPSTDFTVTGLVNSDAVTGVTLTSAGAAATADIAGSPYTITVNGATGTGLGNYNIIYTPALMTVTPIDLTIAAVNVSKVYGTTYTFDETVPSTDFTVTGLINSDAVTGVTLTSAGAAATADIAGSPYTITVNGATGTGLGNYNIIYTPALMTVTPIDLTIAAVNVSKVYGTTYTFDETVPSTDFTVTGLVNSDAVTGVTLTSAGAAATADIAGSPYTITVNGATGTGLGNYNIIYTPALMTVTPIDLTIAAVNVSKVYGTTYTFDETVPSTDFTVTGLINSDAVTGVTLTSAGAAATADIAGSPYTITVNGATGTGLGNYNIIYTPALMTVTPIDLTIAAVNVSKVYGTTYTFDETVPSTDFTVTGLINSDAVTGVTLTSAGAAATADIAGSPYTITVNGATGTGLGNYNIIYTPALMTVTPIDLTIAAVNVIKTYGTLYTFDETVPSTDFTVTGLVNSDAVTGVTLTSAGAAATADIAGSPYTITVNGATGTGLGNYNIIYTPALMTVTPIDLTIAAVNVSKVYGTTYTFDETVPSTDFTVTGLVNSDAVTGVTLTSAGAAATADIAGSPYTITVNGATGTGLGNYNIIYIPALMTVTPIDLTIAAVNVIKTYGTLYTFDETVPSTDFTVTGLVNSDAVTGVTLTSAGAAATVAVGSYPIVASTAVGTGLGNYTITYVNGTLTVDPATLVITANNANKMYGTIKTYTGTEFTTTGLVNGNTVTSVTLSSTGDPATAAVNTYPIVASAAVGTGLGNYTILYVNGTLTVTPATLTITANNASKAYGTIKTYTGTEFTTAGLVNGNTVTSVTLSSTGDPATATVGTYPIVVSTAVGTGLGNYAISYVNGTLTVDPATLVITANNANKVYGTVKTYAGTEFTATGLVNGNIVTSVTLSSTGDPATAIVGTFPIVANTAVGTGLGNYTILYVNGTLTVTPATLTITANNANKVYGTVKTYLGTEFTTSGLVNGNTVTSVTLSSTGDPAAAAAGTYPIVPGNAIGTGLGNYTINYVNGVLTVTQSILTITANNSTKVYGTVKTYTGTEFTVTGLVNGGTVTSVTLASTGDPSTAIVGTYPIVVSNVVGTGLGNYTINYVNGTLTVNPATLTITAANRTKTYGQAVTFAGTEFTTTGLVNGNTVTSVTLTSAGAAAAASVAGSPYTIVPSAAVGTGLANYTIIYVNGALTVNPVGITITANPQTKVYGNADPALTYRITTGALIGTDAFTGALTRAAGENVGTYAILQGTVALNSNYTLSYVGANLTITARPITITADPKTKVYGTADPALTFQITSGSLAGNGDAFSGALTRVPGENVGTYAILQGTVALNSNYTVSYVGANLTITTNAITVTANAQTKAYGTADPPLTYRITSGSLSGTDAFTGALTRVLGENVGTYPIRQGTLSLSSNYVLTFIGADLTITGRPITITADAKTKVYGTSDPVLTYQITSGSLAGTDALTGSLTRNAGENVGTYAITQGTLGIGSNYTITFIGADLTITVRPITVIADNVSRVYGDPDNLTYQITSGSLAGSDAFTGALSHDGGEDVGTYPIVQGTLALSTNYSLTFIGATLTITPRPVTVTATNLSKVYGDAEPVLTYSITSGSLASGDTFTGALIREAGENAGTYAISQGDLALNSNYVITFAGASFTITPRPVTVTADPKTKFYGEIDPELTYQITSGNLAGNGDNFSGALTRNAGESVGTYAITLGTLTLGTNYTLTYVGADLTILKSSVAIVVAADPKTKVYGETDPELTYKIVSGELVGTDTFTGELTREEGEDVGTYAIQQGDLSLGDNYTLEFLEADFTITPRPITVTADPRSKVVGEGDPVLTWEITEGELVANGDAFHGELDREPGEAVGTYPIILGTLSAGDNYDITFEDAEFSITPGFEMNAYPNPFSDHIYFEFDLNNDSEVLLEIYNIIGIKIATVFQGYLTADHYRFEYLPEYNESGSCDLQTQL